MNRNYQLIVFDWDGTLMDSEARIIACIRAASRDTELPFRSAAAIRDIIGLGLKEAIDRLYPGSDEAIHRAMFERYRYHYLSADATPAELFDGAIETLDTLRAAGYMLSVATGKGRVGLDQALAHTGLRDRFHTTRCADETRSKPDPLMLFEIMEHLGADPSDTLMIGDSEYDIEMARNAGVDALAVSYGVHELDRLQRHRPVGHIERITELADWLRVRSGIEKTGT